MGNRTSDFTAQKWRDVFSPTLCDEDPARTRPGRDTQTVMSPRLTYGRHFGPTLPSTRPAAVMILLTRIDDEWQIPLTVRPDHLRSHAGQVSFPGGAREPNETSQQAAIRELQEELGCDTSTIDIVGKLSPIYVYNSDFLVTPWIGITEHSLSFDPDANEVADWFGLSIDDLCKRLAVCKKQIARGRLCFSAPAFECQQHEIWGATSMILSELQVLLRSVI